MLLSALLGSLGSVSLMAQTTNVYSLNVVGYVNVTLEPGYNIITCPLMSSPDNTLNTLFPDGTGTYKGWQFYFFTGGVGYTGTDTGGKAGYANGGTNTISPGQAAFVYNSGTTALTNTFVGTVPSGSITNTLAPGYNLVGSVLPVSGDLVTNTLTTLTTGTKGDLIYIFDAATQSYPGQLVAGKTGVWSPNDPSVSIGEGFFYYNAQTTPETWVENFSVSN